MTESKVEMHYTPPSSDTIQTKPFPIRGNICGCPSRLSSFPHSCLIARSDTCEERELVFALAFQREVQGPRSRGQCIGCRSSSWRGHAAHLPSLFSISRDFIGGKFRLDWKTTLLTRIYIYDVHIYTCKHVVYIKKKNSNFRNVLSR